MRHSRSPHAAPRAARHAARPAALVAFAALALAAALVGAGCGSAASNQDPGWSAAPASGAPGASVAGASTAPAAGASAAAGPSVIPVIVGSQGKGPSRFVFLFLDDKNLPAGTPDRKAQVAFIAPGSTEPGTAVDAEFVWAIEGSRGEYVAHTDFPQAGAWKAIFITQAKGGPQEAIGVSFDVQESLPTVHIGATAPASNTPKATDVGGDLSRISTDQNPDPKFYRMSVAEAVSSGTPFILVFATPAFCQSAQCGPTLDRIKKAAATAPDDIAFINVEPYQMTYTEGRLQPVVDAGGNLQPVASVDQWGILSEPWIFAVDGKGIVRGSYEGMATDQELQDAFKAISGT